MPNLRIHATTSLAAKMGGFAKPAPAQSGDALILDIWYANIIRRRRPRVLLMNPDTLMTVTLPLAPAKTVADRLPGRIAAQLMAWGAPPDFIDEHVFRLHGGSDVVKTESRHLLGILNQRMHVVNHFRLGDDEDAWDDLDMRLTGDLALAEIEGPPCGPDRLALAFETWAQTGVASIVK